ncbi:hypothetical protein N5O88_02900 [Pseudomonas sp. GD03721]|uniref:hypothetical protein n=1 Tax=Ectopseudomonas oleovorans TaxID=301 RepID=UPI00241DCAAB|nr:MULTISPECIES: hypothetical protein [Pseudomonas]MDH1444384.1 hypothetical protein [Pseudomonas sp. GD03722]MDV5859855.1 hypothetical protein [Pseudomonas mendocina]WGG02216.1 hypothetical protein N5O88_02900 [Pseudomonas sp. GD03721]WGG06385.1 hypothetical protein N5O87_02900 [Pseudomonas sp. GD03919]
MKKPRQWLLLAVLCQSSLRRALVKSNANAWSAGMQLTGQVGRKWVGKYVQLPTRLLANLLDQRLPALLTVPSCFRLRFRALPLSHRIGFPQHPSLLNLFFLFLKALSGGAKPSAARVTEGS